MSKPKPSEKPNPDCALCAGKGWFRTQSQWPAQCHRCFPSVLKTRAGSAIHHSARAKA